MTHLAIDYGSNLAGTTVICFEKNNQLHFLQSEKKKNADAFLKKYIAALNPGKIFIDAPLSLPSVYQNNGNDFFYRRCDREAKAMSPMFLGGLTARAMQLRSTFPAIDFHEIYPAQLVRIIFPENNYYKKELIVFCEMLIQQLPIDFNHKPENWHQVDAVLAWLSGWRFENKKAFVFGDENEGLIYV